MNIDEKPESSIIANAREYASGAIVANQANIELTHRCNLKCVHCYLEHKNTSGELDTEEFKRVLDDLVANGVYFVAFTGGELFMRRDWYELLSYAKDRGVFFSLQTNGTLIDEEIANKIAALNPTKVEVSLQGASERTNDAITQAPSSFGQAIAALQMLKERNIRLVIKTTVMQRNLHEVISIRQIAEELGATFLPDPMMMGGVHGAQRPTEEGLTEAQLFEYMKENGWGSEPVDLTIPLERKLLCRAAKTKFTISPDGKVMPCAIWRIDAGDLRQVPLAGIWHGDVFTRIREIKIKDLSKCRDCSLSIYCVRCPGSAYIENGNNLAPSSLSCRFARLLEVRVNEERIRGTKSHISAT